MDYPDLRATVYTAHVPEGAADELPALYSSIFCTQAWFRIYDEAEATGACVLDDPRHVVLFYQEGRSIEVLNKVFEISPVDAARACRALFRSFPRVRRIHVEVMFVPKELRLPKRVFHWTDHWVVELPKTVDEYRASLGPATRRNLRKYENRLQRDHPDMSRETVVAGERGRELFEPFLKWKIERFRGLGRATFWENAPEQSGRFVDLLRSGGEAMITSVAGQAAAIAFVFPVGGDVHYLHSSFDPQYEPYHLGLLTSYWIACDAIGRGARRLHMGWGTEYHKSLLGARPMRATSLSVFRSQSARLHYPREAVKAMLRRLRPVRERYWRARHSARQAAQALAQRVGLKKARHP